MIFMFATTQDLIDKNKFRHEKFETATEPWTFDLNFFEKYDAKTSFNEDFDHMIKSLFGVWVTIVKGDYNEDETIPQKLFVLILTFVANVTLLNLIVAIMSDGYGESMSKMDQKKNKSLNSIILRFEYIMFWRRNIGQTFYLVWVDYINQSSGAWQSQVETINSTVKSTSVEMLA